MKFHRLLILVLALQETSKVELGLTTAEALQRLALDVDDVLRKHTCRSRSWWRNLRVTLQESVTWNYRSLTIAIIFLIFLLLAISFERRILDIVMFLVILGFSILNTFLVVKIRWKRWLLCKEKVEEIRGIIEDLVELHQWTSEEAYSNLYQPTTPSVHLQWTYRDGKLVNLPACLLVRGDVVLLRPGQEIFAECRAVDDLCVTRTLSNWEVEVDDDLQDLEEKYSPGQVFRPEVEATSPTGNVSVPTQHDVQLPRTFGVTKTPFMDSLELMLVRAAEERNTAPPSTPVLCLSHGLTLVHICCLLIFLVGLIEGLVLWFAQPEGRGTMAELFLRPVYVAFSLFPLFFPCVWLLLQSWFGAHFRLLTETSNVSATSSRTSLTFGLLSEEMERQEARQGDSNDRDKLLMTETVAKSVSVRRQLREMWRTMLSLDTTPSELVFSLGTLTALCCIDKKGVLSLPQPTVDKVFFLRRRHHRHGSLLAPCATSGSLRRNRRRSEASMGSNARRDDNNSTIGSQGSTRGMNWRTRNMFGETSTAHHIPGSSLMQAADFHAHVLEVCNVAQRPYEQVFEERHWQRYINSLKPIGLNILLNNCNPEMFPRYTSFADYLTLLADRSPVGREVAAINHRCMCGLARQIGFLKSATQPFQLATSLAAFRHSGLPNVEENSGDTVVERLFRALSSSHHRTPMAHVLGAVTSQARVGCHQLMSQGSADLLLDLCVDYWDGHDLSPLGEQEKRRALDFYHRHIHSAYCTAFAYSPLFESIADPMTDVVLELPIQTVYRNANDMGPRAMIPTRHHIPGVQTVGEIQAPMDGNITDSFECQEDINHSRLGEKTQSKMSSPDWTLLDKLPFRRRGSSLGAEAGMIPTGVAGLNRSMSAESMMSRLSADSISTSEDCMELLKNQVFLGMAALQYQPLADVVPLVNQLQEACVRFVHFSQDNELRSRVFAEKLGLEAGSFNCHISLADRERLSHTNGCCEEGGGTGGQTHRSSQAMQEAGGISRWDSAPVVMGCPAYNLRIAAVDTASDSEDRLEISFEPTRDAETPNILSPNDSRNSFSTTTSVTPNSEADTITQHLRQDKSQMPRGIAAIRPHLKNVDNIPLQVSLFTDCSPGAVREMIEIMQENGEIVCAIGSTLSLHNTSIFLQADCCLGLQPDVPYVCVGCETESRSLSPPQEEESPMALASRMLSLPCSLSGLRESGLRFLLPCMAECRALVLRLHLALAVYFTCGGVLSCVQLLSIFVGWPWGASGRAAHDFFLFDGSCLLWLKIVSVPMIVLPILLCTSDKEVMMKRPPTKRDTQWVKKRLRRIVLYTGMRCLPQMLIGISLAHFSIMTTCQRPDVECVIDENNMTETNATTILTRASMQRSAGQFLFLLLVCFLAILSLSFVKEGQRLVRIPRRNFIVWSVFNGIQILVTFAVLVPYNLDTFRYIHPVVWGLSASVLPLLVLLNEFIDYKETSINSREERRLRFMFNTKLGMYSPV